MPNPEQDLPITSPDGQGLGYGAHEFTPRIVEEDQRPEPVTEAAPPSGPPEEPPITYDAPTERLIPDINPDDNKAPTPSVPTPENFPANGDNKGVVESIENNKG